LLFTLRISFALRKHLNIKKGPSFWYVITHYLKYFDNFSFQLDQRSFLYLGQHFVKKIMFCTNETFIHYYNCFIVSCQPFLEFYFFKIIVNKNPIIQNGIAIISVTV